MVGFTPRRNTLALFFDDFFTFEDIEPSTGEDTFVESFNQSLVFNNTSSGGVDKEGTTLYFVYRIAIDEMVGMVVIRYMERNDVRMSEYVF